MRVVNWKRFSAFLGVVVILVAGTAFYLTRGPDVRRRRVEEVAFRGDGEPTLPIIACPMGVMNIH